MNGLYGTFAGKSHSAAIKNQSEGLAEQFELSYSKLKVSRM